MEFIPEVYQNWLMRTKIWVKYPWVEQTRLVDTDQSCWKFLWAMELRFQCICKIMRIGIS